jgi:hypothetical protein
MDVLARGGHEVANLAKWSASSFPSMSVRLGTQWRVTGAEHWRRALVVCRMSRVVSCPGPLSSLEVQRMADWLLVKRWIEWS